MLEKKLIQFFNDNFRKYHFQDLVRIFSLKENEYLDFVSLLFSLETQGKIIMDEFQYFSKVPKEYYYYHGVIKLSNKNHYYISLTNKERILIDERDLKSAKVGDTVFVENLVLKNMKHKKNKKGKVVRVVKPCYEMLPTSFYYKGVLNKDANGYYIQKELIRIEILPEKLNSAFVGDTVGVRVYQTSKLSACVEEIIFRSQDTHLFVFQNDNWNPIDTETFPVSISEPISCYEGMTILANVSTKKVNGKYFLTDITILKNDTLLDKIHNLALEKGFECEFPDSVLKEVSLLKMDTNISSNRHDLRDLVTITIDPNTAKDLDDAISLEKYDSFYRLYVHIADVPYFVSYGSATCENALNRGTSCYPLHIVIPQFSNKISENLCSLNPDEDKMAKTIVMDIDKNGEINNFDIFQSVIRSRKKMSYDKVNALLSGEEVDEEYLGYRDLLFDMLELSNILQLKKLKRGYLLINSNSTRFLYDTENDSFDIVKEKRGPAEFLIENFMLCANETVANYSYWLQLPFVYRNHESPSVVDMIQLFKNLKQYFVRIQRFQNLNQTGYLQKYLMQIQKNKSHEEMECITELFLAALPRAYYSPVNSGHFGLALDCYGTFTSPIRKGSDFINHIIISEFLNSGGEITKTIEDIEKRLPSLCRHFTERQLAAEQVEAAANSFVVDDLLNRMKSEILEAKILCFTNDFMVVQTTNHLEGKIYFSSNMIFHSSTSFTTLNGNSYNLGDTIYVRICSHKSHKQKVIFELYDVKQEKRVLKL